VIQPTLKDLLVGLVGPTTKARQRSLRKLLMAFERHIDQDGLQKRNNLR